MLNHPAGDSSVDITVFSIIHQNARTCFTPLKQLALSFYNLSPPTTNIQIIDHF